MSETYKATIEVADKKITIEGPREFVEEQIARLSGVLDGKQNTALLGMPQLDAPSGGPVSERELVQIKQPKGHLEAVAVLAFALTEAGTKEFTEEDIRRAYLRAGVRPPKVVAQALRDAKNRFDYIEAGKSKGTYRLSPHGDRTVRFDLPR
jgi:hypothetical protein